MRSDCGDLSLRVEPHHMLADCQWRYRMWKMYRIGPKPSASFFTLGKRFTDLYNESDHT